MNPDSPTPQSKEATAFEQFMGPRPVDNSGRKPGDLQYDLLGKMWDRDYANAENAFEYGFKAGQESTKAAALTPEETDEEIPSHDVDDDGPACEICGEGVLRSTGFQQDETDATPEKWWHEDCHARLSPKRE